MNPFLYGSVTPVDAFLNRQSVVRRIAGRLMAGGQSSALIGQPRMGKTSILIYLSSSVLQQKLYGEKRSNLVFSFVDSHLIGSSFTPAQFWEYVLEPIKTRLMAADMSQSLLDRYAKCKNENFSNFALESLFKAIRQANLCFVLMIDEFDALVNHQVLNSTEFFGGLRSISSRSGGSMALIIASRQPIHALNTKTQAINPASSPFFNIFKEITLRGFPENDISLLLARAGSVFSSFDHQAIRAVAGRHPYLLQVAASALWEAYEDGIVTSYARWTYMSNSVYQEQRSHFLDTWQMWSPATRKAFTTIALCSTEKLLAERTFLLQPFISDLKDVAPEIGDLEAVDLIVKDDEVLGGWRIEPQVMTWWLADELVRIVRSDKPFDQWLRAQEMDNCLTSQEKENLSKFTRSVSDILQQGITKFIDAFAEGIGKGLTSAS